MGECGSAIVTIIRFCEPTLSESYQPVTGECGQPNC
jgi:hypothetical protein